MVSHAIEHLELRLDFPTIAFKPEDNPVLHREDAAGPDEENQEAVFADGANAVRAGEAKEKSKGHFQRPQAGRREAQGLFRCDNRMETAPVSLI